MYTYGGFMLGFDRKQPNSVKQLSFKKKKKSFLHPHGQLIVWLGIFVFLVGNRCPIGF